MNTNFREWAKRTYEQYPDVIDYWKQSDDILERALANAVFEVVGKVKR